jgi:hypothetical protein
VPASHVFQSVERSVLDHLVGLTKYFLLVRFTA